MEVHQGILYSTPTIELVFSIVSNKKFESANFFDSTEFSKKKKINSKLSEFSLEMRTQKSSNLNSFSDLVHTFVNTVLIDKNSIKELLKKDGESKYYLSFEIIVRNTGKVPARFSLKRDDIENLLDLEVDMKIYIYNLEIQKKKFRVESKEFNENRLIKNHLVKEISFFPDEYEMTILAENAIEELIKELANSNFSVVEINISLNCVSDIGIYNVIKILMGAKFESLIIVID